MLVNFVTLSVLALAVRASVIVNVYEDGEDKASHSIRDGCNFRACDQLCRRLGFTGGVCVGDRCKCDNFTPLKDAEHRVMPAVRAGCNYLICNQMCRKLGFKRGTCIGGNTCRCDNSFEFEAIKIKSNALDYLLKSVSGTKAFHSIKSCNFQVCDQVCRNLGFPGGSCVGDQCDCDNFKEETDNNVYRNLIDEEETNDIDSGYSIQVVRYKEGATGACELVKCSDMCHHLNYAGGICIGGTCECY